MPEFIHDDDAILRSMSRIPVIRAMLATRTWPHLSGLPAGERDHFLDEMAFREYRAEQLIHPAS